MNNCLYSQLDGQLLMLTMTARQNGGVAACWLVWGGLKLHLKPLASGTGWSDDIVCLSSDSDKR